MAVSPAYVTLAADTPTPVTLDSNYGQVEVTLIANPATTYFNVKGNAIGSIASPVDGCHLLNATLLSKVVEEKTGGPTVVHLRSTGTPTVCVSGL